MINFSFITLTIFSLIFSSVNAGNCFQQRMNDICYELTEINVNENQCSSHYYSDDILVELDGHVYSENCRDVDPDSKRCHTDCGLGQECQWIDGEEMCVCSSDSCLRSNQDDQPICAANNMTFTSTCAMEAWKCLNHQSSLYKKYDGECQKDCRNVRCPEGKICTLVKNTGEPMCLPMPHCNPLLNPESVCGTDGFTYPNICAMRLNVNKIGRTPELAHRGRCESKCRPNLCHSYERCVYSKEKRPVCIRCHYSPRFFTHSGECSMNISVCGDDGVLYNNYCSLLRSHCLKNQYINIIEYGYCPEGVRNRLK